jgi:hypothetical protein
MPTETVTKKGRHVAAQAVPPIARSPEDDALQKAALRHLEYVRKFRRYLTVYLLVLLVLTPVWIVTQYLDADGWPQHLSTRSRYPGDWDPWIIWVALVGALVVGIAGFRAHRSRPGTQRGQG